MLYTVGACEHTYTSVTGVKGTFSSPGYPEPYPSSVSCRYNFQGTRHERIRITFIEFDLEPGTNAGYTIIFTS